MKDFKKEIIARAEKMLKEKDTSAIIPIAVNRRQNRELIESAPHVIIGDMAIVYKLYMEKLENKIALINVDKEVMEAFGLTSNELFEVAAGNYRKYYKPVIKLTASLLDEISESAKRLLPDYVMKELEENKDIYSITSEEINHVGMFLFDKNVLRAAAKRIGKAVYVIPSGIHELLVFAAVDDKGFDEHMLKSIRDVNRELSKELVLSNSIYRYDPETNETKVIGE